MITIATYGTKNYVGILTHVYRKIAAAANHVQEVRIVHAGDGEPATQDVFNEACKELPVKWIKKYLSVVSSEPTKGTNESNILIAKLQGATFDYARLHDADLFWSVESDVLVPADALKMSEWVLNMPDNYYDVAMVTYPNQLFLGGRGEPRNPIYENETVEERELSKELLELKNQLDEEGNGYNERKEEPLDEWKKKIEYFRDEVKKCKPKGHVWQLNGEFGWRKRGWLDYAYPAVGRGAILPTDWVGMGCTLISKRALKVSSFEGFNGGGTQDLFLSYHRWWPCQYRLCVITHTLCDHVKPNDKGELTHYMAYHEQYGDAQGHLRMRSQPWVGV